jgi:hypothetical protein
MRKFIGWLWDQISQSSDTQTSEYLKELACGPIFTVVTYQGYDINGYMFYTEQQDKKSTYQNSGVRASPKISGAPGEIIYEGLFPHI